MSHPHHHDSDRESAHNRWSSLDHRPIHADDLRRSGSRGPHLFVDELARHLLPIVMQHSRRPVNLIMNFGHMTMDDVDGEEASLDIIYNVPRRIVISAGKSSTSSTADRVDTLGSRARRTVRYRHELPPIMSSRSRTAVAEHTCSECRPGMCRLDYGAERQYATQELRERGQLRGRWAKGECTVCRQRDEADEKGHREGCARWYSRAAADWRDQHDGNRIEYVSVRSPNSARDREWRDELLEMNELARNRAGGANRKERITRPFSARDRDPDRIRSV